MPDRPARAAVAAAVRAGLADLAAGDRVVVGLSGGPDSLALLAATVRVGDEVGLVCHAVVVDHGLQAGSAAVAERARDQARVLGCSRAEVVRVDVPRGSGRGGPEAAARRARLDALAAAAGGDPPAAAVLLGHTRDDQAETVLLGLARGSGTRSLAGMAPRAGLLRRPLLGLPRAVVAAAAAQAAAADPRLEPWTDPHNADPRFARVRVRARVLPELEAALGPGVAAALARTATLARADADALDGWADRVWARLAGALDPPDALDAPGPGRGAPSGGVRVPVAPLAELPPAITTRVVRRLLLAAGCPPGTLTANHVWRVSDLLAGPPGHDEVALPGDLRARREADALAVRA